MSLDREREGEKERRKRHLFVVPLIYAFSGWFLNVPWPGIGPAALDCWDNTLNNWATQPAPVPFSFTHSTHTGWAGDACTEPHLTHTHRHAGWVGKLDAQESLWCNSSLGPKAWEPGKPMFQFEFKGRKKPMSQFRQKEFSFTYGGVSLLILLRLSPDWTRPTSTREDNLLYSDHWFHCKSHPETSS